MQADEFQRMIFQKGDELFRAMPWRDDTSPYAVFVSELMLQQTQVDRVRPKFDAFVQRFPDVDSLASASVADVLQLWQGLGYNRRALYLQAAAQAVVQQYGGVFPDTAKTLQTLPGIGPNTAGAILAYSFNQPVVFIETNIRTVYIYHFFNDDTIVEDTQIRNLLTETLPPEQSRRFYWALMDYGSHLKRSGVKVHRQSKTHKKQPPLEGSLRQMRGAILRLLVAKNMVSRQDLLRTFDGDARVAPALSGLTKEGFIREVAGEIHLTNH